ncbi:MAG: tetratricopeptide repeat protein [Saprospiraceae bacterium]|nr:tetratricopeptide repeat protein [Saprospiraceae bacterium]
MYQNQGKAEEAGKILSPRHRQGVISSLNNLANLYYDQGRQNKRNIISSPSKREI